MLKVRTMFSGIGSPESALKNIGIEYDLVDFCEIDKFAIKSYCAIHSIDESKNLGDISKVWGRDLPYADLLVWGFPCQDISVAGNLSGIKEGETRSGLYYEGFRILKETKPKYSVIENVKNLVGKRFKDDFKQMLEDIESLGYKNYWKVLNAKDYGIPQNRERVFIVSIREDVDDGTFEFPIGFDNGLRLKDFLEDEVEEKFYISNEKVERLIQQLDYKNKDLLGIDLTINQPKFKDYANCIKARYDSGVSNQRTDGTGVCVPCITPDRINKRQNGRRFKEDGDPMFTLTSQDRHGVLVVDDTQGFDGVRTYEDCVPTLRSQRSGLKVLDNAVRLGGIFDKENQKHQAGAVWDKEGMCPTLDTMQGGYRQPSVIVKQATKKGYDIATVGDSIDLEQMGSKTRRGRVGKGVVNTLNTSDHKATLTSDYRIRKLTPKECWRLMGFSDDEFQKAQDAGVSNSQLYKQAGNSIVTNVLAEIFIKLLGGYINE